MPNGQAAPSLGTAGALSPRERQVAALVAQGLTNRQIADQLVVSPTTVASHVQHILRKLDVQRRSQIPVAALQAEPGNPAGGAQGHLPTATPRPNRGLPLALALLACTAVGGLALARSLATAGRLFHMDAQHESAFQPLARIDADNSTDQLPAAGKTLLSADGERVNTVDLLPTGVQVSAVTGTTLLWIPNLAAADVQVDFRAREIAGQYGYAIQLRGCPTNSTDFYNVRIAPTVGDISIVRARCKVGTTVETLLPEGAVHIPSVPPGAEQALTVAMQGQHITVRSGGKVLAEASDPEPPLPRGGVRFAVFPGDVAVLTSFDVWRGSA